MNTARQGAVLTLSSGHPVYFETKALVDTVSLFTKDLEEFCSHLSKLPEMIKVLNLNGDNLYVVEIGMSNTEFVSGEYKKTETRCGTDLRNHGIFLDFYNPLKLDGFMGAINLDLPKTKIVEQDNEVIMKLGVELGESAFNVAACGSSPLEVFLLAFAHEYGHHLITNKNNLAVSEHFEHLISGIPKKKYVSSYAKYCPKKKGYVPFEHFCENFALYIVLPDKLREFDDSTYAYMEKCFHYIEKHAEYIYTNREKPSAEGES